MKFTTPVLATIGTVAVLGAGVAIPALAQDSTPPSPPAAQSQTTPEQRKADFAKELADKLGISVDKVQSALDAIQADHRAERRTELKTRLDQAVADGRITSDQEQAILDAFDAQVGQALHDLGFGGPGFGGPGMGMHRGHGFRGHGGPGFFGGPPAQDAPPTAQDAPPTAQDAPPTAQGSSA